MDDAQDKGRVESPDAVLLPVAMAEIIVRWLEQTETGHKERLIALDIAKQLVDVPRPHRIPVSGFGTMFTAFYDAPSLNHDKLDTKEVVSDQSG